MNYKKTTPTKSSNGKKAIGVFQIKNLNTHKIYISKSNNLENAWEEEKTQLKSGTHQNLELQDDWKKQGEKNFSFEILGEIDQDSKEKLDYKSGLMLLEAMYLDQLLPYGDVGYNIKKINTIHLGGHLSK